MFAVDVTLVCVECLKVGFMVCYATRCVSSEVLDGLVSLTRTSLDLEKPKENVTVPRANGSATVGLLALSAVVHFWHVDSTIPYLPS